MEQRLSIQRVRAFQKMIWDYYKRCGRRFPWRETRNPYAVFVSEVMLQQTQVDRVVPKYREWMKKFPNPETIAKAPLKRVLQVWSGLGYNRRALYLKRAVEIIVREHGGEIPHDVEKLDALPGVGPYTAAAILAFAWNEPTVFIETNIRTVYLHFFFKGRKQVRDKEILEVVEKTLPKTSPTRRRVAPPLLRGNYHPSSPFPQKLYTFRSLRNRSAQGLAKLQVFASHLGKPARRLAGGEGRKKVHSNILENVGMSHRAASVREWYNALMDYGAMLKAWYGNPNVRSAHYAKQKKFAGSRRELRGKILRRAAATASVAAREFSDEKFSVSEVLRELVREGFLKKSRRAFTFV